MPKKLLEMAAAGCILMVVGAIAPLGAQQIVVSKDNRTIAVTTSADATVDADTAIVHIGFVVYGPDQQTAYANGSRISNAVIRALIGGGVDREAIESENQGIAPVQLYSGQDLDPRGEGGAQVSGGAELVGEDRGQECFAGSRPGGEGRSQSERTN